jgi:F0F1-type ATP synthase epsilon subunit
MARTRFVAEVLTPEGEVFNEEIEMLSTRTTVGSIGLLANHEPLLARLEPAELRLYRSETDIVRFAQAEGYVQMSENRALVLVESRRRPARPRRHRRGPRRRLAQYETAGAPRPSWRSPAAGISSPEPHRRFICSTKVEWSR